MPDLSTCRRFEHDFNRKVLDQFEEVSGDSREILTGTQVKKSLQGSWIDPPDQLDLRSAFRQICLIDTYLINPKTLPCQFPKRSKSVEQDISNPDNESITVDELICWTLSPAVGKGMIFGNRDSIK